jgi:chaperonin GroEL
VPSQSRVITYGDDLQAKIKEGLTELYQVAKACYGPAAGIALIEAPYGDPLASRDGVSNVGKVYLEDPVANKGARIVVQASKKNNLHVGDGTTAVVILTYHLYLAARKMIAGGYSRLEVEESLRVIQESMLTGLDQMTVESTPELLESVATIAAGDPAIGTMIAKAANSVGLEGGLVVEDFAGTGMYSEIIEGFFFNRGFTNVNLTNDPSNLESRYENVPILVTDKRLATPSDIAPIMDTVVGAGLRDLIIVGDVGEEAQGTLMLMRLKGEATVTVVDAPAVLGGRRLFLDDLALVTGGKVFASGATGSDFELDMLGAAERVLVSASSTTIVGREGSEDAIDRRIAELSKQLRESTHPTDREALTQRIARLQGELALIKVGGATEVEQKELKLRVQDAVCAVRAAVRGGVVPGGGTALAVLSYRLDSALYDTLGAPFNAPFRELLDNAGLNPGDYLSKIHKQRPWVGWNINNVKQGLVNLREEGITDPALVVKETVRNAVSVVTVLIKATVDISYADRSARNE